LGKKTLGIDNYPAQQAFEIGDRAQAFAPFF
jgi:hypothetical protein